MVYGIWINQINRGQTVNNVIKHNCISKNDLTMSNRNFIFIGNDPIINLTIPFINS